MEEKVIKKVEIYSDGACSGNPGPGGYGTIIVYRTVEKVLSGGEPDTTNNRMELTGVIEGLRALREPCEVELFTDSRYICDAINKGWLETWQQRGWRRANRDPVLNIDLWKELVCLLKVHTVTFQWVKGHSGHAYNERCDILAVEAYQPFMKGNDNIDV